MIAPLEHALAAMLGTDAERVIVTAGADEVIDRICRAYLEPGRTLLLPEPSFDMFDRFAALANGEVTRVPWTADAFGLCPSPRRTTRLKASMTTKLALAGRAISRRQLLVPRSIAA